MLFSKPGASAAQGRAARWRSPTAKAATACFWPSRVSMCCRWISRRCAGQGARARQRARCDAARRAGRHHNWAWPEAAFDVVAAIFFQFTKPPERAKIFAGIKRALKPGGLLLLEGYRPQTARIQNRRAADVEQLYTRELLEEAFGDFSSLDIREYDADLDEGSRPWRIVGADRSGGPEVALCRLYARAPSNAAARPPKDGHLRNRGGSGGCGGSLAGLVADRRRLGAGERRARRRAASSASWNATPRRAATAAPAAA